jgi:hypothetical protein
VGAVISIQLTNGVLPLAIGAVVASLISVVLTFGDTAKKWSITVDTILPTDVHRFKPAAKRRVWPAKMSTVAICDC